MGIPELIVIFFVVASSGLVLVWPAVRICQRVGLSPWLGVLAAVPIANVVLIWVVAFSPWPALRPESPRA